MYWLAVWLSVSVSVSVSVDVHVDVHVYGGTELSLLRTMVRFVWLCACGLC
jgi:hypothetical protein